MAVRHPFGGGAAEWTFTVGAGNAVTAASTVEVTGWSSRTGGTQYTDLAADQAGTTTFDHVDSEDGSSGTAPAQIPPFWGPAGIRGMWLSGNGGPRVWVETTDAAEYGGQVGGAAPALRPIVPLYEYPSFAGSGWDDLGALGYGAVIANPASGPGAVYNSDWGREIDSARAAGMKVLGYVTTDPTGLGGATAGSQPLATVRADIDGWYSLYDVDGIFFDLTPTGVTAVLGSYVTAICDYTHSKGAAQLAVINPGTYPLTADYVDAADVACVYEGDYTANNYLAASVPGYATWVGQYPPTKYLHLVYNVTDLTELAAAADHAVELGVGYFYAADTNSAWLTLPAYWADEVALLRESHPVLDPLDRRNQHGAVPSHHLSWDAARKGRATLNGTTAVPVSTAAVTATSDIQLTIQSPGAVNPPGSPYVSTRTAGTSFSIKSTVASDNSVVGWELK